MKNQKVVNVNFVRQEYRKKQNGNTGKGNEKNGVKDTRDQGAAKAEVENLKRSVNQYAVLSSLPEDDPREISRMKDRRIVDQFLNKKLQPTATRLKSSNILHCSKGCRIVLGWDGDEIQF